MLWNQQKEVALLWKLSFNDVSSQYKDRFQYFLHQSWQDNTKLYCIVQCIIFRHVPHFILTLIIRIFKKKSHLYQFLPAPTSLSKTISFYYQSWISKLRHQLRCSNRFPISFYVNALQNTETLFPCQKKNPKTNPRCQYFI